MIISQAVDLCYCQTKTVNCEKDTIKNGARVLDVIAAITILAIGIMAIIGTIPFGNTVGWALTGAGAVYTLAVILEILACTHVTCGNKKLN